jgi:dynein light chain 4, axonemal
MSKVIPNTTIPDISDAEYKKLAQQTLTKSCDMTTEMSQEALEIITMGLDKHVATKNYEAASQLIKASLDKKFGVSWQCVIGEGFGFDITYQEKNMIYVYYGNVGVLCYKA